MDHKDVLLGKTVMSLVFAMLMIGMPGGAQPVAPPSLTLAEAVTLATSGGSRQLAIADAGVAVAKAGVEEARLFRQPQIHFNGGFEQTNNPVGVFSQLLVQENFQAENFALDKLNRPDPQSDWSLRLSLEQPLWTGGRIVAQQKAAGYQHESLVAQRERTRQEVVLHVIESYANAVLAKHQLAVAQEALQTASAHVTLIEDLFQGGLVVESDLLLAQVRESEIREVLIRAESGVEISRAALNLAMGQDLTTVWNFCEDLVLETEPPEGDAELSALVQRAQNRPDLEAVRKQRAAAESQVHLARASQRPQIGLRAAYEVHTENLSGVDGDNWAIGVGVRMPLFENARARARTERAQAHVDEAREQGDLLAESIALETHQRFYELRAARQRLAQTRKAVDLAKRSLSIVEDRYKEGLITLPGFLDAETALTEARLREVAARRDVILARAQLDLATGDL